MSVAVNGSLSSVDHSVFIYKNWLISNYFCNSLSRSNINYAGIFSSFIQIEADGGKSYCEFGNGVLKAVNINTFFREMTQYTLVLRYRRFGWYFNIGFKICVLVQCSCNRGSLVSNITSVNLPFCSYTKYRLSQLKQLPTLHNGDPTTMLCQFMWDLW